MLIHPHAVLRGEGGRRSAAETDMHTNPFVPIADTNPQPIQKGRGGKREGRGRRGKERRRGGEGGQGEGLTGFQTGSGQPGFAQKGHKSLRAHTVGWVTCA